MAVAQAYAKRALGLLQQFRSAKSRSELTAAQEACDEMSEQMRSEYERLEPFIVEPGAGV
jgi:hypothetical protein